MGEGGGGRSRFGGARLALAAAGLAALGVGVALVGERLGSDLLARRLGPVITLAGAALWLGAKVAARGGRR